MRIKNPFLGILIAFLFAGCISSTDFNRDYLRVNTNKNIYSQSSGENINITAVNIGTRSLYYSSPSFFATLQKYDDGKWIDLGPWYSIIEIVPGTVSA